MLKFHDPAIIPFSSGIIAAGDGSRLKADFPQTIKPLLPIRGIPLVHWTSSSLISAGSNNIAILFNSKATAARDYLESRHWPVHWDFIVADTSCSWESFRLISHRLAASCEQFLISTVDALIPADEISRFARTALAALPNDKPAAALAVTCFVEDEKPLWADLDETGRITAFGSSSRQRKFVTCGLYALNRLLVERMPEAQAYDSLRAYWGTLLNENVSLYGLPLTKTVDVDRPEDVATAEEFVANWETVA